MTQILPQCQVCRHYFVKVQDRMACAAYPEPDAPIPQAILFNQVDHRQPQPGDHGVQFAALPGAVHPGIHLPVQL